MSAYSVIEIFESIQGEGLRTGLLTTFVRFAGCNLRCPWCDTPEALDRRAGAPMALSEIVKHVETCASGLYVVLTGGEPTLQNLTPLIDALHHDGYSIGLETNGTHGIPFDLDWVTVSPKPPRYQMHASAVAKASELKLVVDDDLRIKVVQHLWERVGTDTPVVLQPESGRSDMAAKIFNWLTKHPQWRLGVQLHKTIGVR